MARLHKQSRDVLLDGQDVWTVLVRIEAVMANRTKNEALPTKWEVDVKDEGGTTTEDNVGAAQASAQQTRYPVKDILMYFRTKEGFETVRKVWVGVHDLDGPFTPPRLRVAVETTDEGEALGLVEILRQEAEYVVQRLKEGKPLQPTAAPAPKPSVNQASSLRAPVAPQPTPDTKSAQPWYRSSTFWHNPWVVTLGAGLVIAVVTALLTVFFS
jgi:hypothetical protein